MNELAKVFSNSKMSENKINKQNVDYREVLMLNG